METMHCLSGLLRLVICLPGKGVIAGARCRLDNSEHPTRECGILHSARGGKLSRPRWGIAPGLLWDT